MKLAGDLKEFSLPDFLQIQSTTNRTAAIKVMAPDGVGVIYLESGKLVHARFGDLEGERAVLSLLGVRSGYFETAAGTSAPERTIEEPLSRLLLDFAALEAAGLVPRPAPGSALQVEPSPTPEPEERTPPPPDPAGSRAGRGPALLSLVVASLAGLAMVGYFTLSRQAAPVVAQGSPRVTQVPIEAAELAPPTDTLPQLLAGQPPVAPASDLAVTPTVVCRVLINDLGEVADVKVFRSRVEIAAFEDAAVAAVQGYRFSPALRAGRPVSVWMNLPVTFR